VSEPKYEIMVMNPRAAAPGQMSMAALGNAGGRLDAVASDREWIIDRLFAIDPGIVVVIGRSSRPGPASPRADWQRALAELAAVARRNVPTH